MGTVLFYIIIIILISIPLIKKYKAARKYEQDLHAFKVVSLSNMIIDLSQNNAKGIIDSVQQEGRSDGLESLFFEILFEFIVFYNHLINRISIGNAKINNSQQLLSDISQKLVDMAVLRYSKVFICNDKPGLITHLKQSISKMNEFYKPFNLNNDPISKNLFWQFGKVLSEDIGHKDNAEYIVLGSGFVKIALDSMPFQFYLELILLPEGYEQVLFRSSL